MAIAGNWEREKQEINICKSLISVWSIISSNIILVNT